MFAAASAQGTNHTLQMKDSGIRQVNSADGVNVRVVPDDKKEAKFTVRIENISSADGQTASSGFASTGIALNSRSL